MVYNIKNKHQQYFEATLQLRNVTQDMINFVQDEIARVNMHIAKIKRVTNGFDFQLADSKFTQNIGRKLQEKFGGKTLVTASLFGQHDGKEIYRVTVLFRGVTFKRQDTVSYRGEEYLVTAMGKEIILQHHKTGKKIHVKYKDMDNIKQK